LQAVVVQFLAPGWSNPFVKKAVLPRQAAPGRAAAFTLDLAPPAGGWRHGGRLRIQCASSLGDSRWQATLNGKTLTPLDDVSEPYPNPYPSMLGRPDQMRAWHVPAEVLRDGRNEIETSPESGKPGSIEFLDLAAS
jgi:hypothetical protein